MRPRELTINGFRSYADEVTFEWNDRRLVGIVGPIGSGKSSILDAIAFALYGKTPRVERDTKSLINQRRDVAQVAMTFEVDGEMWRAERAIRRSGASSHALFRLDDGEKVEVTDKARDMSDRIEALLGLDFDAFRRSVLLAQNQFATFLEATGTERNQVLKGVFGFERLDAMRSVAKERLEAIERSLATLAGRRSSAKADNEALVTKRTALASAEEREQTLEQLRVPFVEARDVIATSDAKLVDAQDRLQRLGQISGRIPQLDRVSEIVSQASVGAAEVATARRAVEAAEQARREAATRREEALAAAGGRQGLDEAASVVERLQSAITRLDERTQEVDAAEAGLLAATEAAVASRTAADEDVRQEQIAVERRDNAANEVDQARSGRADARQTHRAHALRAELSVGEPCPVCTQQVSRLPESESPASLDDAERRVVTAEEALASAQETATKTAATASQSKADAAVAAESETAARAALEAARAAVATDRDAVAVLRAAVTEKLGEGDPQDRLLDARRGVDEADTGLTSASAAEESARTALKATESGAVKAKEQLGGLRTELAGVAGALDASADLTDDGSDISQALVVIQEALLGKQQSATGDQARATEERDAAQAALRDLVTAAGLGESDDVVEVIAAARVERAAVEAEVQLLESRVAELETLATDEAELVASGDLLRTIHGDLAPSRFLEFVLDERRRALGDLASEHLEVLTSGRYRFDESGDFLLVDLTAANAVRSPASLSGGETFLASLGLALALAEIVAREGGRLDAFFLDEGFGSLDPEHLDLAMDGVERLVTSGPDRLVVVVSHVPALRDRIEDLVVLDRDAMTGNTQIVAGRTAT